MATLIKYEDVGIAFYGNDDYNQRVYTHPNNQDLKTKFETCERKIRNPYREAYIWIKGECLNLQGMLECLRGREMVMEHQLNLEKKIVSEQSKANSLKSGKTTITNFWKSKSSKESQAVSLQNQIEINEQEVQEFKKLINWLTIYHGKEAIPKFKKDKAKLYLRLMSNFTVKEISNSHLTATLFHDLLDVEKGESDEDKKWYLVNASSSFI